MHNMVTINNNNVYLKFAMRVDLVFNTQMVSIYEVGIYEVMDKLIIFIVVIIL